MSGHAPSPTGGERQKRAWMSGSIPAPPRGTGQGGQYTTAIVQINPTVKRTREDFTKRIVEARGPESPWRTQLLNLVEAINMRDAEGRRAVEIGEYVCIGRFQSRYGARNRISKYRDARMDHLPVVEGFAFDFRFEYVHDERISSELWAALVPDAAAVTGDTENVG